MLASVAFCPQPPILVPDFSTVAREAMADVREACDRAVASMLAAAPETVIVVGQGDAVEWFAPDAGGSLREYGCAVETWLSPTRRQRPPRLPLSLTIGSWLLDRAEWRGEALGLSVTQDVSERDLRAQVAALAGRSEAMGLLVMGDGSACRDETSPGYRDPRALPFDRDVAGALRRGHPADLARIDAALAAELMVSGAQPWRLAGLLASAGGRWEAEMLCEHAPFGVSYLVAAWRQGG